MQYWILKTEPGTYSLDDLKRDKKTFWDGVRNYQARNNLKAMGQGDVCLIYHSVGPKSIVGEAIVVKEAYQDPTTDDDKWVAVDIAYKRSSKKAVTLEEMKRSPVLSQTSLVKQSRLSVCPISKKEYGTISKLAF